MLFVNNSNGQSTEKIYLSGTGNDNTMNWEFFCTGGMNAGRWTTIPVPSCWELQGFGKYDYGFAKDSIRGKEKGLYKYTFHVPAAWKEKQVNIDFEGVMTDAEVKINGQTAGEIHQGAFYAFKYDITKLLKYGQVNLLEVAVSKHSANPSVNAAERRADFWIFGGIFRPVYLEVLPKDHIERVAINAKANGQFEAKVFIRGNANKVSVQLYKDNGIKYGNPVLVNVDAGDISTAIHNKFLSPFNWSPEFPNLYKAVFTLYNKDKVIHTVTQKFGFRTVEVKERDGIYLNGVKVKMKGVNRHSFWPTSGRTLSPKISIQDVLLMKDMNMNAVRMCHYPPDDHFLDACDSMGLFVLDELAGWHGHYDTPTGTKLVEEMLVHDMNHPSIIIWDNGNEGGHNLELDHLFSGLDIQERTVIHPWQLFGGIETTHYREYNYGIGNYDHGHNIVMPTEFLHGLYDGGHGAGLEDYWEAMWKNPLSAGGFLWSFADEGVVRKDKNDSIDTDGNHGPDGIMGPFHEKEGSYFAIKEIWCPVHLERRDINSDFDGNLAIENRYHFTNINQCNFSWKLAKFYYHDTVTTSIVQGIAQAPAIGPNNKGILHLDLPKHFWGDFDVLYITATDPHKHELFTWSFPVESPGNVVEASWPTVKGTKVQLVTTDSSFAATANDITIIFDRNSGLIKQVKHKDSVIAFNNGPVIQEGVNNFSNFSWRNDEDRVIIESAFNRKTSYNTLQWTIYADGFVRMELHYFPADYFTNMVGVNFSFPEKEMKGVEYMGNGPYRVWKNRMKGPRFGIWTKKYNATETGEAPWIYPEFKGYFSNMYWCRFKTQGQSFKVLTENEDIFLRLFTPAFKDDPWHNYQLLFPGGDISFMQAIPAIGNKTQKPETTGPMGGKNIYYDYDKDPSRALTLVLYFDFSGKP